MSWRKIRPKCGPTHSFVKINTYRAPWKMPIDFGYFYDLKKLPFLIIKGENSPNLVTLSKEPILRTALKRMG
jgi:hypothetical protein